MPSLNLTRDWLKNVLRPYPGHERIFSEVLDVLASYRTLQVKTDAFTFDSGQTALLLLLHGTLPINYRGATYQIPINVWVPHEYPRRPPMAFVVPTAEMGVRKSREVDPGGRVREEVVEHWWTSWPTSNRTVPALLTKLAEIFSAVPPVYAKPPERPSSQPRSPAQSPAPAQPTPPPRQYTNGEVLPSYAHQSQASSSGQPSPPPTSPPVPLRPGQVPPVPQRPQFPPPHPNTQSPPFSPASSTGGAPWHAPPVPPVLLGQPPLPSQPSKQVPPPPPPPQMPPHPPQHLWSPPPGAPQPPPPLPPQPPQPQSLQHGQPYGVPPAGGYAAPHQPGPYASQPGPGYPQQHAQQQPQQPLQTHVPAPGPELPPDLMSSSPETTTTALPDSGDAPPVPPSKPPPPSVLHLHAVLLPHLTAVLPPLMHSLQLQKAHLVERREDLATGEPAIRDEMARLEAVKNVCDAVGGRMQGVVEKGEARIADLEQRGDVSVDEVVCSISIVHNQLVDLVAEDNALSDTMYHLTRALDAERIDLDRYLKAVRSLAREQYMKRALIERIQEGMGQASWSS
ncbi:hypothetical protein CspeluHIS016_0602560 [Cutaneotrichosporon spelunceum]|uniref:UEV-domain-containing protein n=1 Tax=Cutaneotrichosporon spelunceum TaxID=1672016 RepID=A0AAD3TXT4_9TREE|nr:hypothetical protein CspeluHIS016_0602560 [Cutaneotrichosporon spelunceum]